MTKQAQHTPKAEPSPGPWEYFEQKEWGRDRMYGCVRDAAGMVVVNGCAPGGTEEQKANARLIAAAPDLVAALKGLSNCHTGASWQTAEVQRRHWLAASAALAKAGA